MEALLQQLLGDNYQIFAGIFAIVGSVSFVGIKRYIQNKAVGQAISKVGGFFTKEMSDEERVEFTGILKKVGSRKGLKALNKLVGFIEQFDIDLIKGQIDNVMVMASGILSVMIKNGAFDDNLELKSLLQSITGQYISA